MYPNGTTKIYSVKASRTIWTIPSGIILDSKSADNRINIKNTKVNINNLDPYSSVFYQDAPIDSKILLFSNIICAANNPNLAVKYIPGSINIRNPSADTIVTIR